ncbi:MAG: hypothetical protein L0Y70_18285 [Gemmataceae bacterium]|nr:hypothetical protein [Gemmataceae bacterium]
MDIYDRGLRNLSVLQGVERLVFMLQDFDNLMEMESWDHFFRHECHFIWYSEMKEWLRTIGAQESLVVLDNHEAHLKARGVELSPSEIETFLNSQDEAYMRACPDWRRQYCELRGVRWAKASAFLESQGLKLLMVEPGTAPKRGGE